MQPRPTPPMTCRRGSSVRRLALRESPSQPPSAPIETATVEPATRREPPVATDSVGTAVDRQLAEQKMGRRSISKSGLLEIREVMKKLPPDSVPMFNPLQAYPHRGTADKANAARTNLTDEIFGYQPKNTVTVQDIIEDIDEQIRRGNYYKGRWAPDEPSR
jgi:hypothetical protein